MVEMKVDGRNIAEYGARLLEYGVSGTEINQTTGTSYNANFPKLFHKDYGLRTVTVTLVFRPQYLEKSGIIAKFHSMTMQKSRFDAVISNGVVEIELPDGFYYRCLLYTFGDEIIDGESLEVTYMLKGIRHLSMAKIKGQKVLCSSTVETDCRITVNVGNGWSDGTAGYVFINTGMPSRNYIKIENLYAGDVVILDGIGKTATKNGQNIFGDTDIITFPFLVPGENKILKHENADLSFVTEYYPTFI